MSDTITAYATITSYASPSSIGEGHGAAGYDSTTNALAPDELRAVESRADVDCLGDLHAQRRQLLITLAPLKALHGPFGLFDDRRKQMLEATKIRARQSLSVGREKKPTEAEIDATAYADPQYERFLDAAYQDKIDYITQATTLSEIEERIRSRELELLVFQSELKLAR